MIITLELDKFRLHARQALSDFSVEKVFQVELNKIVEKHKKAAIKDIEEFAACVAVTSRFAGLDNVTRISINLPDVVEGVEPGRDLQSVET